MVDEDKKCDANTGRGVLYTSRKTIEIGEIEALWRMAENDGGVVQTVRPGAFQDSFQPYLEGIRIAVIGILIFHGLPFFFCVEVSFQR